MVQLNGTRSVKSLITMGVSQGSILGPLLFFLYVNDACFLQLLSKTVLFADDTTIYLCGNSITNAASILTDDLNKICSWFYHNRVIVNWMKTSAMIFSRYISTNVPSKIGLRIQENHIKFVDTFKLVGVSLDRKMNFDNHISIVCKKANQKCAIISDWPRHNSSFLSLKTL